MCSLPLPTTALRADCFSLSDSLRWVKLGNPNQKPVSQATERYLAHSQLSQTSNNGSHPSKLVLSPAKKPCRSKVAASWVARLFQFRSPSTVQSSHRSATKQDVYPSHDLSVCLSLSLSLLCCFLFQDLPKSAPGFHTYHKMVFNPYRMHGQKQWGLCSRGADWLRHPKSSRPKPLLPFPRPLSVEMFRQRRGD